MQPLEEPPPESAPAPLASEPHVALNGLESSKPWLVHEPSEEVVWELSSALRHRRRWRDVYATSARITRRCVEIMAELGVSDQALRDMAVARSIQIQLGTDQTTALQFPWEFAIAESTRTYRQTTIGRRSLLMTRHLRVDAADPGADVPKPDSVLFVESAPGELGRGDTFLSERNVVLAALDLPRTQVLTNPAAGTIKQEIGTFKPSVVHFTGVDSVRGAELLQIDPPEEHGVFLHSADGPRIVSFPDLVSEAFSGWSPPPALVVLNCYNSSLLAAALVESGAQSAIGFQDVIDDAVAEKFFAALYAAWRTDWQLFDAVDTAWRRLAPHARELRGTGIIVWSRLRLNDPVSWAEPEPEAEPFAVAPPGVRRTARRRSTRTTPEAPPAPRPAPPAAARPAPPLPQVSAAVTVDYKAPDKLNYSLLHNNLPLFPEFMLRCAGSEEYPVSVDVALHAGIETARYEASFRLSPRDNAINLASPDNKDSIRVSLTSELARSLAESVHTSVVVHVRSNGQTLRQQTHRVELLAIDEWKDDDLNRQWLPSFVFPRDLAVRQIVDAAQRYLVALADDSGAGFDGYQSVDAEGRSLDEKAHGVDNQVRALWWAIISDFNLAYINPPPTFTDKSQRLRLPSDIVSGRRGTCIDLTLLLASCLEYVEIHPVIFLLRDHAFPGYVRTEESHELIREYFTTTAEPGTTGGLQSERSTAQFGWVLPSSRFTQVMKLVQGGHVVPIETVALTQRSGFEASIEEGLQNLRDRRNFESLFDIRLAREAGVTPLPVWGNRS